MEKNRAGFIYVFAFGDPDHATLAGKPVTGDGANISCTLSQGGAVPAALTDTTATELASGYYVFSVTAAENNYDDVLPIVVSSTANVEVVRVVGTATENNFDAANDAVANVTLTATCTTNTDMRGTDSANTVAPLDAAGIRTAVGLAAADLDTQLGVIDTAAAAVQTDWADGGRLDLIVDAILDDTGTSGVAVSTPIQTSIADVILNRDMSAVSVTNDRSPINALRALRNKWGFPAGVYTVYQENDTTVAWTGTPTSDAAADPITGVDPA